MLPRHLLERLLAAQPPATSDDGQARKGGPLSFCRKDYLESNLILSCIFDNIGRHSPRRRYYFFHVNFSPAFSYLSFLGNFLCAQIKKKRKGGEGRLPGGRRERWSGITGGHKLIDYSPQPRRVCRVFCLVKNPSVHCVKMSAWASVKAPKAANLGEIMDDQAFLTSDLSVAELISFEEIQTGTAAPVPAVNSEVNMCLCDLFVDRTGSEVLCRTSRWQMTTRTWPSPWRYRSSCMRSKRAL